MHKGPRTNRGPLLFLERIFYYAKQKMFDAGV